ICGTRTPAIARGVNGDGGTTFGAPPVAAVDTWSRLTSGGGATILPFTFGIDRLGPLATCGGGATTPALLVNAARLESRCTSGGGATIAVLEVGICRILSDATSGVGGTTAACGNAGKLDRNPEVGGGPGVRLIANKLATGKSDFGILSFG